MLTISTFIVLITYIVWNTHLFTTHLEKTNSFSIYSLSLHATVQLVRGTMQLFSHPSRKSHVINHHYASCECGNLTCLEGYTDTLWDHNMHGNFIWYFPALGKSAFYGLVKMAIFLVRLQYWIQHLPEVELMCPIPKAVISSSKSFKLVSISDSILIVGETFFEVCVCHTRT